MVMAEGGPKAASGFGARGNGSATDRDGDTENGQVGKPRVGSERRFSDRPWRVEQEMKMSPEVEKACHRATLGVLTAVG